MELMTSASEIDEQAVMIDATIVRAHLCTAVYEEYGVENTNWSRVP